MLDPEEVAELERLPSPLIASTRDGRIAYMNQAACDLLGWDPADCVGQPLTLLMPARMHRAHLAGIQRYMRTHESRLLGRPVRVPALRKDGREVEVELLLRMFRRPDGSDLVVAALRDVVTDADVGRDVLRLETRLQRRAYELV
jgi:PAS domain S-box-containing protein